MTFLSISRALGILTVLIISAWHFDIEPTSRTSLSALRAAVPAARVPFEVGETFTYNVSWKIFDAGVATMTLAEKLNYQNEDVYKITATARSTGIVATVFRVLDIFESYLQVKELCSRRISKTIQEGRRKRETLLSFDRKKRQARLEDKDLSRPGLPVRRFEASIPYCVQDVITSLYIIRTKPLKVGETLNFPINDGGTTYDVLVEVQAEESVRTPAGTFHTLRLEPRVFGGLFRKKGRMFVWLTNDFQRIPVQLKAKINIGTITASLTKIEKTPTIRATSSK